MPSSSLSQLQFERDSKQLRAFAVDGCYWWDVASGRQVRRLARQAQWFSVLALTPCEDFALARMPAKRLALVSTATGRVARTFDGHRGAVFNATFSPDGTKLFAAGGSVDPRVIIWDVQSGKPLGDLRCPMVSVDRVVVSPDGRWLAAAALDPWERDADVRLWDLAQRKLIYRLPPRFGKVSDMTFSRDSRLLVSGGGVARWQNIHASLQIWDVTNGKEVCAFFGHEEPVTCVSITPDKRLLATGDSDKTLCLWETASGMERRRLTGHDGNVESLDFSPNGRWLASASPDVPAFIWDIYSTEILRQPMLATESVDRLWQHLADADAMSAFDAICVLLRRHDTVTMLRQHWSARPKATAAQVQRWIRDLDSKAFAARARAADELERFLPEHESLLRQSADKTTSPDVRQRLHQMLSKKNFERLRRTRMLEVLEHLRSPESKRFLHELAHQNEDATLAKEATESLQRLGQR